MDSCSSFRSCYYFYSQSSRNIPVFLHPKMQARIPWPIFWIFLGRSTMRGAMASTMAESSSPAPRDVCTMDQHCMNGGTCESANDVIDHRHCVCHEGYSGPRCSHYCPLDCQNKGYCTLKPLGGAIGDREETPTYDRSDYMCKCFGHFAGDLCQIPYTNCNGGGQTTTTRCYNGGECNTLETTTNEEAGIISVVPCQCPPGYGGDSCEIVVVLDSTSAEIKNAPFKSVGKGTRSALILLSTGVCLFLLGCFVWRRKRRRKAAHFGSVFPAHADNDEEESHFRDEEDCNSQKAFELHRI